MGGGCGGGGCWVFAGIPGLEEITSALLALVAAFRIPFASFTSVLALGGIVAPFVVIFSVIMGIVLLASPAEEPATAFILFEEV